MWAVSLEKPNVKWKSNTQGTGLMRMHVVFHTVVYSKGASLTHGHASLVTNNL